MAVIAHRTDGDGEPLLLLNGGLMTIKAWDEAVERLGSSLRVVRCDFRGQLMSLPLGDPPVTMAGHAADLVSLLDALKIDRAHVVGVSFGALAAIELAARHRARVQSLVLVSATDLITPESRFEAATLADAIRDAAAGGDGRRVLDIMAPYTFSPEWLEENRARFEARRAQFALLPRAWYAGLSALLSSLEGVDVRPLLTDVSAPALVVAGERDRTFPLDRSRALAAGIPGAGLHIVPRAAHGWVAEDPAAFAAIVRTFVSAHPMRGSS